MADKLRPSSMSDDDRAYESLGQRRMSGVPYPVMDPDPTPLPMEPPAPSSIPGYSELSDPIQAQIDAIHLTQKEQDVALARMWDARKLGEEVQRLSSVLGGLSSLAGVPELVRVQSERMRLLLEWRESAGKSNDKLTLAIEGLDQRLRLTEQAFARIEGQLSTLSNRVSDALKRTEELDDDLEKLGHRIDEDVEALAKRLEARFAALELERTAQTAALALRVVSLEADRSRFKWTIGIVMFFAAIFAWFASSKFWPGR